MVATKQLSLTNNGGDKRSKRSITRLMGRRRREAKKASEGTRIIQS